MGKCFGNMLNVTCACERYGSSLKIDLLGKPRCPRCKSNRKRYPYVLMYG